MRSLFDLLERLVGAAVGDHRVEGVADRGRPDAPDNRRAEAVVLERRPVERDPSIIARARTSALAAVRSLRRFAIRERTAR